MGWIKNMWNILSKGDATKVKVKTELYSDRTKRTSIVNTREKKQTYVEHTKRQI